MDRENKRIAAEDEDDDDVPEGETKNDDTNDENSNDEENSSDEDESENSEESDDDDEGTRVEKNDDKKNQKKLPEIINNSQKKSVVPDTGDTPIENHPQPTNTKATSKLVIGLIVFAVYISTMIITGGTVYAAYNWRGSSESLSLLIPTPTPSPEQTYTTTRRYTTESGWSQSTSATPTTSVPPQTVRTTLGRSSTTTVNHYTTKSGWSTSALSTTSMPPQILSTTLGRSSTTTVNPLSPSQMSTRPGSSEIIATNSDPSKNITTTSTQSPLSGSHQNDSVKPTSAFPPPPNPPTTNFANNNITAEQPAVSNQSTASPTTGTTLEKPESIKNISTTETPTSIQGSTTTEHSSPGVNENILVTLSTTSPQSVTTPSEKPESSQSISTTENPVSPPKTNTTTIQPAVSNQSTASPTTGTTLEKPESIKNISTTETPTSIQGSTTTEHSSPGANESILVTLSTKSPQFATTPSEKPGSSQSTISTTEYPASPPKMNTTTIQPGANPNPNIPTISGTRCPYKVFGTCPPVTNCTRQNDTCRPRPTQPCVPPPPPTKCPETKPCLVCRDSGENKCPTTPTPKPTPKAKPTPPIDDFLKIENKNTSTVVEWLNMYPPYSAERLIVVTTLLEETIERWALAGFLHRCSEHPEYPIHETKCTFCNDRYKYIKCVMSNTLVGQVHPVIPGYFWNVPLYHEPISFYNATMLLPRIVLTNHTNMEPQRLGFIFDAIERSYKAYHVKTENGGECRICEDFNRAIYNKCFSFDKQYPRDGVV